MPHTASIPPYRINTHETTAERHSLIRAGKRNINRVKAANEKIPQAYIHRQSSAKISDDSEDVLQHTTLRHNATGMPATNAIPYFSHLFPISTTKLVSHLRM